MNEIVHVVDIEHTLLRLHGDVENIRQELLRLVNYIKHLKAEGRM